ncbi:MAG: TlpA family protein disulfide reductase [Candidatus Zambryskibacteria bacterium]|nr:TlpA family protein disulfide reductase [Candidatus Zambryskibacteria bacterium]
MQTNSTLFIGIVILLVLGGVFLVMRDRGEKPQSSASDFDTFASISLMGYQGNNVSLSEFRGKPLVINSWAVWCPFCREELPDFAELQKEFGDDITVIAIDRQEPLDKARGYTDELGISNDMLFLLDSSDSFYKSIGGFSMPETIFVNSAGDIVIHKRGPMELEEMREHVNKIISRQGSRQVETNETSL